MPLEILAFAWAPFVVVQPLLACGLLVLLAVSRRLLGEMPTTDALVGVGLIIAGIVVMLVGIVALARTPAVSNLAAGGREPIARPARSS